MTAIANRIRQIPNGNAEHMTERITQWPLADYPATTSEKLRYGDTDRQGHINNAVFATLFESGRVDFLCNPQVPLAPSDTQFVIAEITIKFLGELTWPGDVTIGTGVSRVGNASFSLVQAIFAADRCMATAQSAIVLIDEQTRRSTPLPQATRDALAALHMHPGA